jgi:DNA-directed RNA polymerase specialized sigma24 family protein
VGNDPWMVQLGGALAGGDESRARRLVDGVTTGSVASGDADAVVELLAARAAAGSRLAVDLLTEVVDHLRRRRDTRTLDGEDLGEAQRISSLIATREDIRRLVAQLPERHRVVLSLRDVEHLSYAEIAERLALPLNTVRSHIHRARAQLAARLAGADA